MSSGMTDFYTATQSRSLSLGIIYMLGRSIDEQLSVDNSLSIDIRARGRILKNQGTLTLVVRFSQALLPI